MPWRLAKPKATMIAAGVASPKAQGQEITNTAAQRSKASAKE